MENEYGFIYKMVDGRNRERKTDQAWEEWEMVFGARLLSQEEVCKEYGFSYEP